MARPLALALVAVAVLAGGHARAEGEGDCPAPGSYFAGVPKIEYEGPRSTNPFAFRYYNRDEIVLGKSMKDWAGSSRSSVNGSTDDLTASPSPFPVNERANEIIRLVHGKPWDLQVDAVVNSTSEALVAYEGSSEDNIHTAAGPLLAHDCSTIGRLRTVGDARITGAHELRAGAVIHIAGPRYGVKYKYAAENALSHSYRACLELLVDSGLRSIAFGCIYAVGKTFPREQAAHIAIRTLRRFTERYHHKLSAVVLSPISPADYEIYRRLLPLYFPRTPEEEREARGLLPGDTGNETGGITRPEREIRIGAVPFSGAGEGDPGARAESGVGSGPSGRPASGGGGGGGRTEEEREAEDEAASWFTSMAEESPDEARRRMASERGGQDGGGWSLGGSLANLGRGIVGLVAPGALGGGTANGNGNGAGAAPPLSRPPDERLHRQWLARARAEDTSEVALMRIVMRTGIDRLGRQVLTVVGAHYLPRALDPGTFLMHVVKEVEVVMKAPYTIVYLHAATTPSQAPDIAMLKRLHAALGPQHAENLAAFYVVHPGLRLKAAATMLTLMEPRVWGKVRWVDSIQELHKLVPEGQVFLPAHVMQKDADLKAAGKI